MVILSSAGGTTIKKTISIKIQVLVFTYLKRLATPAIQPNQSEKK